MNLDEYGGLEISEVEENIEPGKYVMQYVDEQEIYLSFFDKCFTDESK